MIYPLDYLSIFVEQEGPTLGTGKVASVMETGKWQCFSDVDMNVTVVFCASMACTDVPIATL